MTTKDWIDIALTISTVIISLVALFQSNKSIRMTEQSIKDANRPYLSVYAETIDTIYFSAHLVLKNFGNTSAKILNISVEGIPKKTNFPIDFSSLIGGVIAPNQKFTTAIDSELKTTLFFQIQYQELDGTLHTENFAVKTDMARTMLWISKENGKDTPEASAIKKSAHAIIKAFK